MTDDGKAYTYVFDGFGRLRKIKNRSNGNLVEEFWYNGLNHRISWKYDTDTDGDVDANDKKYHVAYDERWRIVAVYREDDTPRIPGMPKEIFGYHNAWGAADGAGGLSYIDQTLLREKDANNAWTSDCCNWWQDNVNDLGWMASLVTHHSQLVTPHSSLVTVTPPASSPRSRWPDAIGWRGAKCRAVD